jgi:adenylate cyclase, class 2
MHFEVEQKFFVQDTAVIERKLREVGAQEAARLEQVDIYFNHPSRDFSQTDEALRIRQVGQANFITYKGPKVDAITKTRREIEVPLGEGREGASKLADLLTALGFRRVAEVRKIRRTFHINWQGSQIEAALDDVTGVGTYLELEIATDEPQLDAARFRIAELAQTLGLSTSERRSYLELLLEAQKKPPVEPGAV